MKKFISGFLTATVLLTSVTVFASGGRMIEVFDNVKKIVVNKVNQPFSKENAPFIYNGTTYVPLKFVADALGEPVDWDGKTGTLYIGQTENNNANYWDRDIKHMSAIEQEEIQYSYNDSNKVVKDNLNNEYVNYLKISTDTFSSPPNLRKIEFPLNGQFKEFKAKLAPTNENLDTKGILQFKVYVDDKEIYKTEIKNGDMPKDININVAGGNKIAFELTTIEQSGEMYLHRSFIAIGLFDGEFIK